MTLVNYIGYSCIALFIIYWITLNFFTSNKKANQSVRPKVKSYSFFKHSKDKMSKVEAKRIIDNR